MSELSQEGRQSFVRSAINPTAVLELIEAVRDTRLAAIWYEFKLLGDLPPRTGDSEIGRAAAIILPLNDGGLDAPVGNL